MRRSRGKPTPAVQSAPIQPGPPQDMPQPGEFPPSPMGMLGAPVGQTPLPSPGMHHAKVSKSKGKFGKRGK